MNIATILFTYRRSKHTRETLEALRKNIELPEKLFVFQDGYKEKQPDEEWKKVGELIRSIEWCDCEVIVSDYNKGLANSIFQGVSYVLKKYDAVIVLEDDCVPHPLFMSYMNKGLKKYEKKERVYSICGNAIPFDVPPNGTDAYFLERIDTWGWGTWKDRWAKMKLDYSILGRIKNNFELNRKLEIWGKDFECYFLDNIYGRGSSWATFWGMTVIENEGVCLSAYESFIKCIGLDGSGTNCTGSYEQRVRNFEDMKEIVLPDEILILPGTEEVYEEYSRWTSNEKKLSIYNKCMKSIICLYQDGKCICHKLLDRGIQKVAIWGKGDITDILIKDFKEKIEIKGIIESKPSDIEYKGIAIMDYRNVPSDVQLIVVIPSYDYDLIKKKINIQTVSIEELLYQM